MNKKKIGIITFHSSHNCGSMLQAYALQTVLEKRYGAEVEIIDFSNKGSRNLYGLFDFRLKRSALKHNLLTIRYWKLVNQYRRDYINFKETILDKGIMPSEKVLDFPVDCNTLTGSVNL